MRKIYEGYGLAPCGAVPNERQLEWYDRKRTIFFHFGMNTFTNKEWGDGTESPSLFNPSELDIEQWIIAIKDGGFTTAILTAKHHDGFCLWPSKYTEHSIKNSPYKNGKGDIVKEFTTACNKHGIKAGIYLSPWDRHEKSWGTDKYNDYYAAQLTELFSNYGKIWECWWDGAGSTETSYDWKRFAGIVRTLQPDAVIFGSLGATPWVDVRWVGNEKGVAGKPCYATIDESSLVYEYTNELNSGKLGGERFIPAEVDVSIRPGWFYHKEQDDLVRSPSNLIDLWFSSIGSNAGLLLNLPPDRRGLICENDVNSIKEFNRILNASLSVNLAKDAEFIGEHLFDCEAKNLVADEKFYLPKEKSFEVKLPEAREFNTLIIGEGIELGHRVIHILASAFVNGDWKPLFERSMIGYKLAERFEPVLTDRIKIELDFLDTPPLLNFGLYRFDTEQDAKATKSDKNLLDNQGSEVTIQGNEIDVNLGGIFPFNEITVFGADSSYKLYIFNGTAFEPISDGKGKNGKIVIKLSKTIDSAYRFLLVLDGKVSNDTRIEVKLK